jgi:hypothetical protein
MKSIALKLLTALALAVPAFAAEKEHKHDKKDPGPNGGRVITAVKPHLEVLITKDRKVQITALTDDLKPAKLGSQVIAVTAGDRSKPTKLEFKEEGGKLISSNTLPDGSDYPVSVSIKADAKAKAVYEKFNLDLGKCPTCKLQEYACICAHSHD